MTQPTKAPIFFRPAVSLPNYGTAQMTVINPVPVIRPCGPLQWAPAATPARTPTPGVTITYPAAPPIASSLPHRHCRPVQSDPPVGNRNQTWPTFNPLTTACPGRTHASIRPANASNAIISIQNDLYSNELATIKSPRATAVVNTMTIAKPPKMKRHTGEKCLGDKVTTEALQETIHRQRELIGKLISVIVKDRLKKQDKSLELSLKDGEVSDVEKLLKITDSVKGNNIALKPDKTATISFSSGERKRRTRTTTGEKKGLCKRLRKDKKSPTQSFCTGHPNVKRISSSVVATETQSQSPDQNSSEIKDPAELDETEDIVTATTARVLDLMHPNGDSQLFSLRVEFARQLKSLEEDFEKEYEAVSNNKEVRPAPVNTDDVNQAGDKSENGDEVSDDSDWLPSSAASSPSANRKSTSLSSDSSGESYSMVKKKFPKRKHVRCYKPFRRNKERASREKNSGGKAVTSRQASGKALKKIDRLLRHYESDNANNNAEERRKNFPQRALQKLRQSVVLWNKMSTEISSYLLTDKNKEGFSNNDESSSYHEYESTKDNIVCVARNVEDDNKGPEDLAVVSIAVPLNAALPPNNKTDPTFMLSKFFQFLPGNHGADDITEQNIVKQNQVDDDEESSRHHGCLKTENNQKCLQSEKSVSDIFKDPDLSDQDDVDKESTNHSAPFLCQFNYPEAIDPDIIGEVIVVTTAENVSPLESCQVRERDSTPADIIKEEMLLPTSTEELFIQNCESGVDLEHPKLFEDLPPERDPSTPSSVIRLNEYQPEDSADEKELPKFELHSYLKEEEEAGRPLVQMFRPLNSESKDSVLGELTPPSEILITKVVSLNTEFENIFAGNGANDPPDGDSNSVIKSKSRRFELKKNLDEASQTQNKESCGSGEVYKNFARPLKKLISDMKPNGKASNDVNVVEWGLVQRRAMHLAKQRIQEQLCGGEKREEESNRSNSTRRLSLRSHGGDGTDVGVDAKKSEKKKNAAKKPNKNVIKQEIIRKENLAVKIKSPSLDSSSDNEYVSSKGISEPD